jgi:hypothetical protein
MTSIDRVDFGQPLSSSEDISLYDYAEKKKANLEKVFNVLGYIPCVSSGSGITRGLYGLIEIMKSCVAVVFVAMADWMVPSHSRPVWYRTAKHVTYAVHGFANVFRGFVECLPLVTNNLILIAYDLSMHRHEYPVEIAERLAAGRKVGDSNTSIL